MNAIANHIDEIIAGFDLSQEELEILRVCQELNRDLESIEKRLQAAADTASCLANGIKPD